MDTIQLRRRQSSNIVRLLFVFFLLLSMSVNMLSAESQPDYVCYRVNGPPHIDGRLDESFWQNVPDMEFREIAAGSDLPYPAKAKMVWDDKYLYIGISMEEPNVWATSTKRGEQFYKQIQIFAEVFLDPDGDGADYVEIHINPLNNVYDLHLIHDKRITPLKYHFGGRNYEWDCNGLETAVYVEGTINNPDDRDKYWSLEMAIPWSSLLPFTLGKCPPAPGDKWAALVGRTYHPNPAKKERIYGTWPVIGELQCHFLDKWGFILFSNDSIDKAVVKEISPDQIPWRLVWAWTLPHKTNKQIEEGVAKAKSLGFNAMVWNKAEPEFFIRMCRKYEMESYYCVAPITNSSKGALQKMRTWEYKLPSGYKQDHKHQGGGEPLDGCREIRSDPFCCFLKSASLAVMVKDIRFAVERGYDGIALDGIGYNNYFGCFCNTCCLARERYLKNHPGMDKEKAISQFNEEVLVKFYERVIAYAKSAKPTIKTTCHVWPVFLPNILYGNRLPIDYCGQTVAWFYKPYWSLDKVEHYARIVVEGQAAYHSGSVGAPFIAFFSKKDYRIKENRPAERVRQEIQIVKEVGANAIQFAELGHILAAPEVASVIAEELGVRKIRKTIRFMVPAR